MRICILGTKEDFTNKSGKGVQRYMYELTKGLHKNKKITLIRKEYPTKYIGSLSLLFCALFSDLSRCNIIHNLEPRPLITLRKTNAIFVTTIHDFHPFLKPELNPYDYLTIRGILGRYLVMLPGYKSALRSNYLIANSTQTRDEALKLGFDKTKIFVVPLGIDKRFINTPKIRNKHKSTFKVGYIGALSTTKNLELAINAFMKIPDKNMVFEIWGKKEDQFDKLEKLCKDDSRIKFMGFAPEIDLVGIYDSFDVFIHTSLYEGFGLPILEAQSRGVPVIIYTNGQIPSEVRKYCIEASDANNIAKAIIDIRNGKFSKKRETEQIRYSRKFTWTRTINETIVIYKRILNITRNKSINNRISMV
jgi:glycosyltransferase involved in cell wall biosynthesis